MSDHFYTIGENVVTEVKIKGSRFLGFAFPFSDKTTFKTLIKNVKEEHPKASHFCFAYRLGTDGTDFRSSDDGEPSGTAGKPILGQLDSKNVTNTLIVVVRYFGGTMLGVPGLIDAYKTTASLLLQLTPIIRKNIAVKISVECDYTSLHVVLTILKKYNSDNINIEQGLFCRITAEADKKSFLQLKEELTDVQGVQLL